LETGTTRERYRIFDTKRGPKAADPVEDSEGFRLFVRRAFHQRRKTLWNNLKEYYDTSAVPEATLKLRAEALSVGELIELFAMLRETE
jgi:16S rRNA (adenine1518-N6/adenine1519-N6)-dimethyltransferase